MVSRDQLLSNKFSLESHLTATNTPQKIGGGRGGGGGGVSKGSISAEAIRNETRS